MRGKEFNVLASWGEIVSWLDEAKNSVHAIPFLEPSGQYFEISNTSLRAVEIAHKARSQLRSWINTPAARAAGAVYRRFGPAEWWNQLARYRFLLSPTGSGIQTAKNIEALLVLTIPIVTRPDEFTTYDELVEMGFPIVLVRRWSDVTLNRTAAWWAELSPRLHSFRRNCLTAEGFWRMYMGDVSRCE
uniref:Exostosin GT47 domain-containing protein n=1 Tax=Alexandrium catenella TaxID=2925 RepID=A0A7S1S065_ALECA